MAITKLGLSLELALVLGDVCRKAAIKFEARNPKLETIPNYQNSNDPNHEFLSHGGEFVLVIGTLEFWVCFGFRYSNFGFIGSDLALCPVWRLAFRSLLTVALVVQSHLPRIEDVAGIDEFLE